MGTHHKSAAGVALGGSLLALYCAMSLPATAGTTGSLASTTTLEIGAGLAAAASAFLLLKK